jgi:hypothetical protein
MAEGKYISRFPILKFFGGMDKAIDIVGLNLFDATLPAQPKRR